MTAEEIAAFRRCVAGGGVALFPADTVYGLATHPESEEGVRRLYEIKGRPPSQPAAVMFFGIEPAIAAVPELGPRTRAALESLLPARLTVLVRNPARRFPLACGPQPQRLGLRVPEVEGPLAGESFAVLQSSANLSGGPEARRLEDVERSVRDAVDLALDGGELPGTASTVVDLTGYEDDREYAVVRAGAVPAEYLDARL